MLKHIQIYTYTYKEIHGKIYKPYNIHIRKKNKWKAEIYKLLRKNKFMLCNMVIDKNKQWGYQA